MVNETKLEKKNRLKETNQEIDYDANENENENQVNEEVNPMEHLDAKVKEIRQLELFIMESNLHLNELLTLLNYLQQKEKPPYPFKLVYTAMHSLTRLFTHFHSKGYLKRNLNATHLKSFTNKKEKAEWKVNCWLKKQFILFESFILTTLNHINPSLQLAATHSFIQLITLKCNEIHHSDNRNLIDCDYLTYVFPCILNLKHKSKPCIDELLHFLLKFDDLRFYFFKLLVKHLRKLTSNSMNVTIEQEDLPHKKTPNLPTSSSFMNDLESMAEFGIHLLQLLSTFPSTTKDIKRFLVGKSTVPKDHSVFNVQHHKHSFSDFILEYLTLPLSLPIQKKFLLLLPEKIMPYLVDPKLLMSFLTDSYNQGGSISLLALQSLFELITKHNLNYPEFYKKLYQLFDHQLLHVKYRSRFFRLFETFMASTHLPAYLVAAFIKRMARLALFAPPSGIMILVPFMYNLLKDHPQCLCLLHRTDVSSFDFNEDPFRMEELDPLASNAMDSSLWELEFLELHSFPNLASLFQVFKTKFTKPHYELTDFLDYTYTSLLDSMIVKTLKSAPPLSPSIVTAASQLSKNQSQISLASSNWMSSVFSL